MTSGPLSGLRIVVTRPRPQAAVLVGELEAAGAVPVPVPVIAIDDPADGGAALRAALAGLAAGDWLVLTSPNGAERVGRVVADVPLAAGVNVAVVGPGTAAVAENLGLSVDLLPGRSIAEGLLEVFPAAPTGGGQVVLARAEVARDVLPVGLTRAGWTVDDVAAYRTVTVPVDDAGRSACRSADAVVFTSSSTVSHLVDAVGVDGLPSVVVSIGPATSATCAERGVEVTVEASTHTIPGIVTALQTCFSDLGGGVINPPRS